MRLRGGLGGALLALAALALPVTAPAAAQTAAVPPSAIARPTDPGGTAPLAPAVKPSEPTGGIIDTYSRIMFAFNRGLYTRMDAVSSWWAGGKAAPAASPVPAPPPGTTGGLGNVVANLVNEPVTALTALAVGDVGNSWRSVERFAINSTVGVLGYYDTATAWGYGSTHTDAGLSLCKAGVGEGTYLVLPFIGPRTVRDAVSDVVLANAVLWVTVSSVLGTGASLQTILIAESVEIVADIVATRQIDPQAKALVFADYDTMRDRYLAQRRARCAALRGDKAAVRPG